MSLRVAMNAMPLIVSYAELNNTTSMGYYNTVTTLTYMSPKYMMRKVEWNLTMFRCKVRKVEGTAVADHGVELCTKPVSRKSLQV